MLTELPAREGVMHKANRHTAYIDKRLVLLAQEQLEFDRGKQWVFWDEVIRRGLASLLAEKLAAKDGAISK